jgi:hypothetical protein
MKKGEPENEKSKRFKKSGQPDNSLQGKTHFRHDYADACTYMLFTQFQEF